MRNAISKAQKMVAKIKAIESTTVAKDVLKEFRKYICNAFDAMYEIIDKDIRDLIENKSRDNQIILLSEIIKRL